MNKYFKFWIAILVVALLLNACEPKSDIPVTPTPTDPADIIDPPRPPEPTPTVFDPPVDEETPILEPPMMPRADDPYRCTIVTHIEPLPYCINWNRWNWYSDLFSADGHFATRQVMDKGIYDQVLNYSEYIDKIEIEFRCNYGVHTFNHSTDKWVWVNVTTDELEIFASDPDWISNLTQKSWYNWCEKEEPAFAECFFSYVPEKTPYYSCKNAIATQRQVYIFALTQDDTQVRQLDWYRNGTFYRSELNPPYDYLSPVTYFEAPNDDYVISIGTVTTLRNGTIYENYLPEDAGFILFDYIPDPYCGDLICNGNEDCTTCAIDCGNCMGVCGDGTCDANEDCSTCEADCGVCPPVCGDGVCELPEDCVTCEVDCGVCPPVCGDGTCDATEDCSTCEADCGACCDCCDQCILESTVVQVSDYIAAEIEGLDFMCIYETSRFVCYEN